MVLDNVLGAVPAIPVTVRLKGATPVEHETDRRLPENDAVHPFGVVPGVNVTVFANPLTRETLTVAEPVTVASVVMAGTERLKSWIVIKTSVVLDRVWGVVPATPVTRTSNGEMPEVQSTDNMLLAIVAMHPLGTVPALSAIVPAKPLMGVIVTVDVPETVARVVMAGEEMLKS